MQTKTTFPFLPVESTRSKNRSDSMQLRVIIGFKKIYLMPMMTCPVARSTYHNLISKTSEKMEPLGGPLLGFFSDDVGNLFRLRSLSVHLRCQPKE